MAVSCLFEFFGGSLSSLLQLVSPCWKGPGAEGFFPCAALILVVVLSWKLLSGAGCLLPGVVPSSWLGKCSDISLQPPGRDVARYFEVVKFVANKLLDVEVDRFVSPYWVGPGRGALPSPCAALSLLVPSWFILAHGGCFPLRHACRGVAVWNCTLNRNAATAYEHEVISRAIELGAAILMEKRKAREARAHPKAKGIAGGKGAGVGEEA